MSCLADYYEEWLRYGNRSYSPDALGTVYQAKRASRQLIAQVSPEAMERSFQQVRLGTFPDTIQI
jgi:hypothetical protein